MAKEEIKKLKETAEAHGTLSEEEALKKAEKAEKVSEEMIEKETKKEEDKEKAEGEEKQAEFDKKEDKEKEKKFERRGRWEKEDPLLTWVPKTKLGKETQEGKIKNIDEILDNNKKILESEIVDTLIKPESDLISIGQSKGKFGGGKRRAWRQTQRKTKEGNVPTFSALAVVGDSNGHVGIGTGKSTETLPARDKATRKAKLNVIKIKRNCAAFDCDCSELHTIPFEVNGKAGSVRVKLIPAPQGTGLVAANEMKKILKLAGIKDVYSRVSGRSRTTFNLAKATMDALEKTTMRDKK
jgi:small subunit ribosomal protein S5